jgi:hypothetical protein
VRVGLHLRIRRLHAAIAVLPANADLGAKAAPAVAQAVVLAARVVATHLFPGRVRDGATVAAYLEREALGIVLDLPLARIGWVGESVAFRGAVGRLVLD